LKGEFKGKKIQTQKEWKLAMDLVDQNQNEVLTWIVCKGWDQVFQLVRLLHHRHPQREKRLALRLDNLLLHRPLNRLEANMSIFVK